MTGTGHDAGIAMGCMRLSTDPDRDDERAIGVVHAALDAGVTLLDTADVYALGADDVGHNERLIAKAIASWQGDRDRILVATKGGLTRPRGRWVADGRGAHLAAACEASRRALGVECLHLYQLHAPDPRTPLSTSVRALARLKHDGVIAAIGLCNVTVGQIDEARGLVDIDAVQVEVSVWHDVNILNGVVPYCIANGIDVLAYRPLGGRQRRGRILREPLFADLAAAHGATPFEIAIAWLKDFSPHILPLPGPTRIETVQSSVRAHAITLTGDDRARLDVRFPAGRLLRERDRQKNQVAIPRRDGEVVLIMGLPAAGKSSVAQTSVTQGYTRLNRDEAGGSLADLVQVLDRAIESGGTRFVLDNTYVSRASRAGVIEVASRHGLPVRCVWLTTSVEDAQVNAVHRILSAHGRLPTPDEIRRRGKRDVWLFGPMVQFRHQRELEPPDVSEGFSKIEQVAFERRPDASTSNRALILWCDGVLRRSRSGGRTPASADDVELLEGRREVLSRYHEAGWRLLGLSWHPEITEAGVTAAEVESGFARMQELLGLPIEVEYCPHAAGPPVCWCRKPLPGLGVVFIRRYGLDPARCIYVGAGAQDPGFARRLGFQYRDAAEFFEPEADPQG